MSVTTKLYTCDRFPSWDKLGKLHDFHISFFVFGMDVMFRKPAVVLFVCVEVINAIRYAVMMCRSSCLSSLHNWLYILLFYIMGDIESSMACLLGGLHFLWDGQFPNLRWECAYDFATPPFYLLFCD